MTDPQLSNGSETGRPSSRIHPGGRLPGGTRGQDRVRVGSTGLIVDTRSTEPRVVQSQVLGGNPHTGGSRVGESWRAASSFWRYGWAFRREGVLSSESVPRAASSGVLITGKWAPDEELLSPLRVIRSPYSPERCPPRTSDQPFSVSVTRSVNRTGPLAPRLR
jgi:hypothetical protein